MNYSELKYRKISVRVEDQVGIVVFSDNPPDNYFTLELMDEFSQVLDLFEQDNDVRCVLFTHEGPDFSHSAGPAEDEYMKKTGKSMEEMSEYFNDLGGTLLARVIHFPKPTIVAAKGLAMGAAAAFYECFDLRLAGESFNYFDADIFWGPAGTWGMMTTYMPLWLGRNKFLDFLYFGEHYSAHQLYELGMVSRVYPDETLELNAMAVAKKLATAAPLTVKAYKERMYDVLYGNNIPEWRRKEMEMGLIINATEDARMGVEYGLRGETYKFKGR